VAAAGNAARDDVPGMLRGLPLLALEHDGRRWLVQLPGHVVAWVWRGEWVPVPGPEIPPAVAEAAAESLTRIDMRRPAYEAFDEYERKRAKGRPAGPPTL
jgi:hypothetical protein